MTFDYFDIHSHIHDKEFDGDRVEVLARMRAAKTGTITVGTHLESSKKAVALAEREPDVWATVGIHPTDTRVTALPHELEALARHPRVVAIGECGLDYFRGGTETTEKARQRELFEAQIELALKLDKPLMIHGRPSKGSMDAYYDILDILYRYSREAGEKLRGNVHFFAGDTHVAKKFLELGFSMSFTGVITFASDYDRIIGEIPLPFLMAETDSPYATPVPHRGKRNEPCFVKEVVSRIGSLRGEGVEAVREAFVQNAARRFSLQ